MAETTTQSENRGGNQSQNQRREGVECREMGQPESSVVVQTPRAVPFPGALSPFTNRLPSGSIFPALEHNGHYHIQTQGPGFVIGTIGMYL